MGMVENARCKFVKFAKDIAVYLRTLTFVANEKCAHWGNCNEVYHRCHKENGSVPVDTLQWHVIIQL